MGSADIGGKRVLGEAPETWVHWLFDDPTLQVKATLTEEFRFVLRHSDELLLVQGEDGPFLLLTELQLHRDANMGRRIRAYAALAEEKYAAPVYPVVFRLLQPGEGTGKACYHSEFMGLMAHQDYRVIEAWTVDAREVLEREVLALIPYVPLMKGADEETVRASVKLLRQRGVGEEMEVVLALFASFVMDAEQVRRIVRWNMAVLRESPWYQEILQEGWQEGRQEGWQEGRQEGWQEGERTGCRKGILKLLQARFDLTGEAVKELSDHLETITDLLKLEDLLVVAAQVDSLDAFRLQLNGADHSGEDRHPSQ